MDTSEAILRRSKRGIIHDIFCYFNPYASSCLPPIIIRDGKPGPAGPPGPPGPVVTVLPPTTTTLETIITTIATNTSTPSLGQGESGTNIPWWVYVIIALVLAGIIGGTLFMWLRRGNDAERTRSARSSIGSRSGYKTARSQPSGLAGRRSVSRPPSRSGLSSMPTKRSKNISSRP